MENIFAYLLTITDPAELKLTLVVMARATGRQGVEISEQEISSLTGLDPAAIARGQRKMTKRGYIFRYRDCYKVIWDRLAILPACPPVQKRFFSNEQVKASLKRYFTSTGFFDLLPVALKIAHKLNYSPEEMIEAICKVADKLKTDPPTRNRLGWFKIVYQEKLQEARADILALQNQNRKSVRF